MAEMEKAYQLDPLSLLTMSNYAVTLVNMRQLDTVEPVMERLSQMDPARGATVMASILTQQGKIAESAVEVFRGVDLDPSSLRLTAEAAFTLARFHLYDDALGSGLTRIVCCRSLTPPATSTTYSSWRSGSSRTIRRIPAMSRRSPGPTTGRAIPSRA